jgi:SAM-dependent methyltransferase
MSARIYFTVNRNNEFPFSLFLLSFKQVAICDNLELPFRDESFDAVLSLAVVHHFATTERRVSAIRELARILRIGGRVIITVWALEQKSRRFESQDVLIPM